MPNVRNRKTAKVRPQNHVKRDSLLRCISGRQKRLLHRYGLAL